MKLHYLSACWRVAWLSCCGATASIKFTPSVWDDVLGIITMQCPVCQRTLSTRLPSDTWRNQTAALNWHARKWEAK